MGAFIPIQAASSINNDAPVSSDDPIESTIQQFRSILPEGKSASLNDICTANNVNANSVRWKIRKQGGVKALRKEIEIVRQNEKIFDLHCDDIVDDVTLNFSKREISFSKITISQIVFMLKYFEDV